MASRVRGHTGGQTKTTGNTLAGVLDANVAADNVLILVAGIDNAFGTTSPDVTGISVPGGESASWQFVGRFDAPGSSGSASVLGELWVIRTTVEWASSFTPTVTWDTSRNAKTVAIEEWAELTTSVRSVASGTSLTGTPSATAATVQPGDVVIGAGVFEQGVAITGDSDTTNGSWSSVHSIATTGGLDPSNVLSAIQSKIVDAAGAQTYNPTGASTDAGVIVAAFEPEGVSFNEATGSLHLTGEASGSTDYLAGIRAALENRDTTPVDIGIYGASVVEGYPAPPLLWLETQLAQKLRAYYPTDGLGSDGGAGYAGIPTLGLENTATSPFSYSTGVFNETLGWGGHHRFWQQSAAQTGILMYTCYMDSTRLRLHNIASTAGAANGGRYRINGGAWVTFNTLAAGDLDTPIDIDGSFSAGDTLEVQKNPGTTGSIRIHGVTAFGGDETKGIRVHNHGHYGYRIQDWNVARSAANPGYFYQFLAYDLIIMSDWGGNDGGGPGNLSAADFKTALSEHIGWMRSVGYTGDILLSALYDLSGGRTLVDPWDDYVQAMREVAAERACAFIDLTQYMPDTPNAIYDADAVHGNADGSAYDMMTDLWLDMIANTGNTATGSLDFSGEASGSMTPVGEATGSLDFSGEASGSKTVSGNAEGGLDFSGEASGSMTPVGEATGSLDFSGEASGSAPTVGAHSGGATGALDFSGEASGSMTPVGEAAGSLDFSGEASGSMIPTGVATGSLHLSGYAGGGNPPDEEIIDGGTATSTSVWIVEGGRAV